jgi:hypothetical protein
MRLRVETEAALAAIDVGLSLSRSRVGADQIQSKGGRDLVTATELAVEDAIRAALLAWRPERSRRSTRRPAACSQKRPALSSATSGDSRGRWRPGSC